MSFCPSFDMFNLAEFCCPYYKFCSVDIYGCFSDTCPVIVFSTLINDWMW